MSVTCSLELEMYVFRSPIDIFTFFIASMVSTHGKTSAAAPPKLHEARRFAKD